MKKSKPTAITIIAPSDAAAEVNKFIPRQAFQQFSFWGQLKEQAQNQLVDEGQALGTALVAHGASGLAIGQHLSSLKELLDPYTGAFRKVCAGFKFTERNAYRYIKAYSNATERFPEQVIRAIMAHGMNVFGHKDDKPLGKYTEAYRLLPPPKNPTPETANKYAVQLEQTRKEIAKAKNKRRAEGHNVAYEEVEEVKRSPEYRLRRSFQAVKNNYKRVPAKKRREWLDSLIGMILNQAGITSRTSFSPEAIPEEFIKRGRPPLNDSEAA